MGILHVIMAAIMAVIPLPQRSAVLTSPVVFVFAHQDDETLAASVAVAEHAGQDVRILFATNGEASSAIDQINGVSTSTWWGRLHHPSAEGYAPLTVEQFSKARIAEAECAVAQLASPSGIAVHYAGLPDGAVSTAAIKAKIVELADAIAPGAAVRLKGHTWRTEVEGHPDHLAIGNAIHELALEQPGRFGDRRYYALPNRWGTSVAGKSFDLPGSADISARVVNAARCYSAWAPGHGSYAIGYHSVPSLFAPLTATPKSMMIID